MTPMTVSTLEVEISGIQSVHVTLTSPEGVLKKWSAQRLV
jgi:hypothetical protein